MVVLARVAFSYEQGTPVLLTVAPYALPGSVARTGQVARDLPMRAAHLPQSAWLRFKGLGLRVEGLSFCSWCGVLDFGSWVWGLRFRVWGLWFGA